MVGNITYLSNIYQIVQKRTVTPHVHHANAIFFILRITYKKPHTDPTNLYLYERNRSTEDVLLTYARLHDTVENVQQLNYVTRPLHHRERSILGLIYGWPGWIIKASSLGRWLGIWEDNKSVSTAAAHRKIVAFNLLFRLWYENLEKRCVHMTKQPT